MLPEIMKAVPKQCFPKGGPGMRREILRTVPDIVLGMICILFAVGLAACSSGAGSSTSAGATGAGSSGVGWTVNVKVFASTLSASRGDTTSVVVTVRDGSGTPAPRGTQVNVSSTRGSVLLAGSDNQVTAGFLTTNNDIGEVMFLYTPTHKAFVTITQNGQQSEVERFVSIDTGIDRIQASSMGAFGSATMQIVP